MSRIGKLPISIPQGVNIRREGDLITVKGPKGELNMTVNPAMNIDIGESEITVTRPNDLALNRSAHGLTRTLLANMVEGVSSGYTKNLEIVGVGFRAEMKGAVLQLSLGFSHPIMFFAPDEIQIRVPEPTKIEITGSDKQLVGQIAAKIRAIRPPEPYKGKGVKYQGEQIRRKAGKTAG